jgi:glycine oxidase
MTEKINSADCIVVGGGLLGMLSARRLAREGLSVALLEQGELFREASWAGGGILSPLVPWDHPDAVTALVSWSQQYYPLLIAELEEQTGVDPE